MEERKLTNAEMIKALRWCGSDDERHEMCVDESYSCPMWNEDRMTDYCKADLMLAAADALEAAEKRIATYQSDVADLEQREKELNDVLNERARLITELNTKCADLQSHINSMESEIEELLPKEGESIDLSEKYALLENGDIEPLQYEDGTQRNAYRDCDGLYYLDHDTRVEFGSIYGYAYLHDRIVKTSDTKAVLMSTRLYAEKHHPEILKGEQE